MVLRGLGEEVGGELSLGELDEHEVATLGLLKGGALRKVLLESGLESRVASVEGVASPVKVLVLETHVDGLLDEAKDDRVEASTGVELAAGGDLGENLLATLEPAGTESRGKDLAEGTHAEDLVVLGEGHHGGGRGDVGEGKELVDLVTHQVEVVLGGKSSELLATLSREGAASRVVGGGHNVHHLGHGAGLESGLKLLNIESLLVHGDLAALKLEVLEDRLGKEVGGLLGVHKVASLEEERADESKGTGDTVGHHDLVRVHIVAITLSEELHNGVTALAETVDVTVLEVQRVGLVKLGVSGLADLVEGEHRRGRLANLEVHEGLHGGNIVLHKV